MMTSNRIGKQCVAIVAALAMTAATVGADVLEVDGSGRMRISQATITGAGSLIPDAGEAFTIEAWINPDTHGDNSITGWGTRFANGQNNGFRLGTGNITRHYFWANDVDRSTGNLAPDSSGLAADGWNHLVISWDGVNTRQVHLNGVQLGADHVSAVPNVTFDGNGVTIGSAQDGSEGFNGQIDEVRVWNTALTGQQLRTNYNRELTGSESNLVAYWNFDNPTSDSTGNGHTGALEGDATIAAGSSPVKHAHNGIVGFWEFNNGSNVGEATVGQNLNANNGAGSTTGNHGGAVSLDGTNQSLSLAGDALPGNLPLGDGSYTISAWIDPDTDGSRGIVGWGGYGNNGQVNATRLAGTTDLVNYSWGGAYDIARNSGGDLIGTGWHHVAAVYDAATSTKTLYVDGVQIGTPQVVSDLDVRSENFRIGSTNLGEYFDGAIDDVAISTRALSADIVGSIANGASPLHAPLISLWRFDDAGDLGKDSTRLGNDVTAQGNAAYSGSGKYGGAASLDGNGDFFDRSGGIHGLPGGDTEYTIAAWVNADVTGSRGIVGWGNYGSGNQVTALRLAGDNGIRHYWWGADLDALDGDVSGAGVDIDADGWVHIAATYDGTTRTIWINGVPIVMDTPAAHNASLANFRIGSTNFGEFFDGLLDDVAIFNLALDQGQLQRIMTGNFAAFGIPAPAALPAGLLMIGALATRRRRRSA